MIALAKTEVAIRTVQTHLVAFFEHIEHPGGTNSLGNQADNQFKVVLVAGRTGNAVGSIDRLGQVAVGWCLELYILTGGELDGIRLDQNSINRLADEQAKRGRGGRWALWIGALSLAAIAASTIW